MNIDGTGVTRISTGQGRTTCGWWIDHNIGEIAATLRSAMGKSRGELHAMGARGRAWMKRDFSWNRIARDMLDVYRWLKVGGEPPATVRLD